MQKNNAKKKREPKKVTSVATNAAKNAAVKRVHEIMKLAASRDEAQYRKELAKLVDKFGADFVSDHACRKVERGGKACSVGQCRQPYHPECTCKEGMAEYIDAFVGYRTENPNIRSVCEYRLCVPTKKRG
jgi:hypothetical protein